MSKRIVSFILALLILSSNELVAFAQAMGQKNAIYESNIKWEQDVINKELSESTPDYNTTEILEEKFNAKPTQETALNQSTLEEIYALEKVNDTYETDRFIIKYKTPAPTQAIHPNIAQSAHSATIASENTEQLFEVFAQEISSIEEIKNIEAIRSFNVDTAEPAGMLEAVIETGEPMTANDVFNTLEESGIEIDYIQPDFIMSLSALEGELKETVETIRTAQSGKLVGETPDGFETSAGTQTVSAQSDAVIVAIIDTGFDTTHEALRNSFVEGWDFFNNDDSVDDEEWKLDQGHATHISGIIAAGKGFEVEGVASEAKIMPIKVFQGAVAYTSSIIEAINFAEVNGAKIANCSWGTAYENPALKEAIEASNMLFVCAAGNGLLNNDKYPVYPASYKLPNVVSVGSVDNDKKLSKFSNYGIETVDITAPGEEIKGTWFDNTYIANSGTSMSASIVSGAAALILRNEPDLSAQNLKSRLISSSALVTGLQDKIKGGKLVDTAYAASSSSAPNPAVFDVPDVPVVEIVPGEVAKDGDFELYAAENLITFRENMPTARHGLGVVAVNNKIYAIGGQGGPDDATYYTTVEEYNPEEDKWETKASMNIGRSYFGIAVVDKYIYVMGGKINNTNATSSVEAYNTTTNTWEAKRSMPTSAAAWGLSAVEYKGDIYTSGGVGGINAVYKYSVAANSWGNSPYGNLYTSRAYHNSFVYNDKLYIEGGQTYGSSIVYTSEETFDFETRAANPTGYNRVIGMDAAVITSGCSLLSIGGRRFADSGYIDAIDQKLLTEPNTVSTKRYAMSSARAGLGAAEVGGIVYIIGGINKEKNMVYKTVEAFEAGYTYKKELPEKLEGFKTIEANGEIYLLGGKDSRSKYSRTVYKYDINNNNWINAGTLPAYYVDFTVASAYGKIYIMGGETSTNEMYWSNNYYIQEYDVIRNTWRQLDYRDAQYTLSTVYSGKIYSFDYSKNVLDSYDIQTGTWDSLGSVPNDDPYNYLKHLDTYDNRIYIFSDNYVYIYDLKLQTWETNNSTLTNDYIVKINNAFYGLDKYASFPTNKLVINRYDPFNNNTSYYNSINNFGDVFDACPVNNKIYLFAGKGIWAQNIIEYMPSVSPWLNKTPLDSGIADMGGCVVGNKIYLVGGVNCNNNTGGITLSNNTMEYSVETDRWTPKAGLNIKRKNLAVAAVGNKIYAIGGDATTVYTSANPSNVVEEYDIDNDKWTTKQSFPYSVYGLAAASYDGKVYTFGGYTGTYCYNETRQYYPLTNSWSSKAVMPSARYGCSAITLGHEIYVIGGIENGAISKKVEVYDPANNVWLKKADMPEGRAYFGIAGESSIYVICGYDGGSTSSVLEYLPNLDKWETLSNINISVQGLYAAVVNGGIYAIGGKTGYRDKSTGNYTYYVTDQNIFASAESDTDDAEYIHYGTDQINPSGNLSRTYTDMSYEAPGFNVQVSRTYNSRLDNTGSTLMSKGWSFGFQGKIDRKGTDISVSLPNGSNLKFKQQSNGSFLAKDSRSKLTLSSIKDIYGVITTIYTLTTKDQYKYIFNSSGYLIQMKDPNGNTLTIDVDSAGRITKVIDQVNRYLTIYYSSNRISQISDFAGRIVKYEYDTYGRLSKVIDPLNNYTAYTYDTNGYLSTVKVHSGANSSLNITTEVFTHDVVGSETLKKVKTAKDIFGNIITYTYDKMDGSVTETDSNKRKTITYFDHALYPTRIIDPLNREKITIYKLENGINRYGEPSAFKDVYGNWTYYERDQNGNITTLINPDNSRRTYTYNSDNRILSEIDEIGNETKYTYTGPNLTSISKMDGTVVSEFTYETKTGTYTIYGLQTSQTNAEGKTTRYTYNTHGYLESKIDPMGNTEKYTYNILGWLTSKTDANNNKTIYYYDKKGNIVRTTYPFGIGIYSTSSELIYYDYMGNIIQKINPVIYADGLPFGRGSQTFDSNYIMTSSAEYYNNTGVGERYVYSNRSNGTGNGQLLNETNAENETTSYLYDQYGNIKQKTMPNASIYIYVYDDVNRLKEEKYKESSTATEQLLNKYEYSDLRELVTTVYKYINKDEYSKTSVTTDYAGRVLSKINPDGSTETMAYHENGLLKSTTDANGGTTYFKYDALGNMTERWTPASSNNSYICVKWDYNKIGKIIKETRFTTEQSVLWSVSGNSEYTAFAYNDAGTIIKKAESAEITANSGKRIEYEYDACGNATKEKIYYTNTDFRTTDYTYDSLGRKVSETVYIASKDLNGQPNTETLIPLKTSYEYDIFGNVLSVTRPDNIKTTNTYDFLGRQLSQSYPNKNENSVNVTVTTSKTYDKMGNIKTLTDERGNVTTYTYNGRGYLTKKELGGNTEVFEYDLAGRLIASVSANNYKSGSAISDMTRTVFTYDNMGRQLTKTDVYKKPGESEFTSLTAEKLTYDNNNNVLTKTDAMGYVTKYEYDFANRLTKISDPLNNANQYEYDAVGRKIKEINAKGYVTVFVYDTYGRLTSQELDGTVIVQNTYDYLDNLLTVTDANGNITTNIYNLLGKLRSTTLASDDSIGSHTVSYKYDRVGNLIKKSDPISGDTTYTYDNMGKVTNTTDTSRITTRTTYDTSGNPYLFIDGNGNYVYTKYDIFNRLVEKSIAVENAEKVTNTIKTIYEYDKNGNKLSETNWLGNKVSFVYDELNRLIEKKDPNGLIIEKLEYNDNSAQIKSVDAHNKETTFGYDANGRQLWVKDQLGYQTSQTYDSLGNIKTKTDGNNKTIKYEYDSFNRLKKVKTNNDTLLTEFTYDNNGNMLSQKDGKGNVIRTQYNVRNLPVKKTDQAGLFETYAYYSNGQLKLKVDRNNVTSLYTYSPQGLVLTEKVGDDTVSYTYDKNGNQLTMTDSTGTTTRTYDGLNRVITKTVPVFGTTTYVYDITSNIPQNYVGEKTIDSNGNITTKIFDKASRLIEVRDATGTTSYEYFDNGNLKNVNYPAGLKEEYTYYDNNKLKNLTNKRGIEILDSYSYGYDGNGNLTGKVDGKGLTMYEYTDLNQLLTVSEPIEGQADEFKITTYTYDLSGNRLTETVSVPGKQPITTTCTYNSQNRIVETEKVSEIRTETYRFSYDNNGNMISRMPEVLQDTNGVNTAPTVSFGIGASDVFTAVYEYDSRNRMVIASENGATVESKYNGAGLRVEKYSDRKTTHFMYEYDKIVLEKEGDNFARNVHGLNLISRTSAGDTAFYMYNGHNDVTKLVSEKGNIIAGYYYDAFGQITEQTGETTNPYTYSGYFFDSEVNLYYLKARYYDARIARFMTEDTYRGKPGDALSLNLYTYCSNNPLVYWDPTGHYTAPTTVTLPNGKTVNATITNGRTTMADGSRPPVGSIVHTNDGDYRVVPEAGAPGGVGGERVTSSSKSNSSNTSTPAPKTSGSGTNASSSGSKTNSGSTGSSNSSNTSGGSGSNPEKEIPKTGDKSTNKIISSGSEYINDLTARFGVTAKPGKDLPNSIDIIGADGELILTLPYYPDEGLFRSGSGSYVLVVNGGSFFFRKGEDLLFDRIKASNNTKSAKVLAPNSKYSNAEKNNQMIRDKALKDASSLRDANRLYDKYMSEGLGNKIDDIWDKKTIEAINTLHPSIRDYATEFILKAQSQGIYLRITSGYRSIEEQDELYAQGRTKPGSIVTNAKGGQSYHNFGLAFDVVEIKNGNVLWDNDWNKIGNIGKSYEFEWGGDWNGLVDKPHFQMTFGFTEKELFEKYTTGNLSNGYVKLK